MNLKRKIHIYEKQITSLKRKNQLKINKSKNLYYDGNIQTINALNKSNTSGITNQSINDFYINSLRKPKGYRYSDSTYSLSVILQKSSPSAYDSLAPKLILPSRQSIHKKFNNQIQNIYQKLFDIHSITLLIKEYRQNMNLPSVCFMECILAVDAICFRPYISISKEGEITGIKGISSENSSLFQQFSLNYLKFEKFIRKNYKKSYSAAFVYQVQPLNKKFRNIVVHMQPETNGKATQIQVDTLNFIRNILKNVHIKQKN